MQKQVTVTAWGKGARGENTGAEDGHPGGQK